MRTPSVFLRIAMLVAGAVVAMSLAGSASALGTWTALAPVPTVGFGVEGMFVGQVGDVVVAAYGDDLIDRNTTRLYDIASNTWSVGAPAPLPARAEGTAVSQGGNVYALGGRAFGVLGNLERYNVSSDTWTTLAPMPTPRAGLAAAVVGDSIYAIGGRSSTGGPCSGVPTAAVERYDISTDTWTSVAPLLFARSDLAAYAQGGKIYVFGGCTGFFSGFLNTVDVYNPVTNTWSSAPADMPTARAGMYGAGGKGDRIYVMGGENGDGPLAANEYYKVAADQWFTDTPMLTPRGEMGIVSHGGRIYTVGGALPAFGASSNENDVFKP